MAIVATIFNPLIHGYRFTNRFSIPLSETLPLIGKIDLGSLMVGLCGGMCFSVLDNFHAGVAVRPRKTIPKAGTALSNHLILKQIESLIPPDGVIKVLNWTAREDRYIWRHTAGREFGKLRHRLGKGEPAVLALIRAARGTDPLKNHQVVAHQYQINHASGDVKIGIYDPNHPSKKPTLSLNIQNPNQGIGATQSTGEPLRGFFIVDYKAGKAFK